MTLFELDNLPRVISGTSAGASVAVFLCTRTDDELRAELRLDKIHDYMSNSLDESWYTYARRLWQSGGLLDYDRVEAKLLAMTRGPVTFAEAYARTGRHLNISVQPTGKYRSTMVFSHITAPDVVIATAMMASGAIPFVLNKPVTLKKKLPNGEVVAYESAGVRWSDGSFQGDLPMQTLRELFGVSYFIVSQVNPHIVPFFFHARAAGYSPGRGRQWRGGFLPSAFEAIFKLEMQKNLKFIADLDLLPSFLGQNWNQLFLQEFEGQTTILPTLRPLDYAYLLSDFSPHHLARCIQIGKTQTWRRITQIRTRFLIANTIEECEARAARRYRLLTKEYYHSQQKWFPPQRPPRK